MTNSFVSFKLLLHIIVSENYKIDFVQNKKPEKLKRLKIVLIVIITD